MEKIEHKTIHTNGINLHVAELGQGQPILFLHGFPELWYSWRHQMLALSSLGFRTIAPDLRGYGDSDAPKSPDQYTVLHVVGDLVGLLDALGIDKVFLVGHDWGAIIAWNLCLFRPDRVMALVNTSVCFRPRHPVRKPVETLRAFFGDDYYVCRFQEPGEAEEVFTHYGTERTIKIFLTGRNPQPPMMPKKIGFGVPPDHPLPLPSWLSEEDVKYYASKFDKSGFTGGLNYYRCLDLSWELTGPWHGQQIQVPVKFIIGDQDITYHIPGAKEYIHGEGFKRDVPYLEEVVVMEGVAHFLTQEKPDEISSHIYNFIKKFQSSKM
uniref:soluble epoxide hydrolase n=1 Tax=Kalanchoe fedtschenkoi TaxID=63787 RepID=A0A7N0SVI6_KALFE